MRATLSSPHTHTTFTDGRHTAEEMVLSALKAGFVSLGFSEHAKQDFDCDYALNTQSEQAYIATIGQLQEKYKGQIRIYLGIERDVFSTAERAPYDYVLASVHYLDTAQGKVAVDGDRAQLVSALQSCFHGDGLNMAAAYYRLFADYVGTYKPDIIGHFDLVAKYNQEGQLFDAQNPRYVQAVHRAMDRMITGCDMMEVNTGAILRSGATSPYPALPWLAYWRTLGGRVLLSSDCHHRDMLSAGYEKGLAVIREAGYRALWYLNPEEGSLFTSQAL